jgi:putative ABC transport system permease protein
MVKIFLRIAWRNMLRNKTTSLINVVGLATGIACVILISLYVHDETGYDTFFKNAKRIYQVDLDAMMGGQGGFLSNTPPPVGAALQRSFPEIQAYTRFYVMGNEVISNDPGSKTPQHFTETKFLAVDSNFLEVFDYAIKEGDPASCLQKPYSIVLTETTAKKYFGTESPLGKDLILDEYKEPFTVTAVLKDIPSQATIQFDLLIPTAACPLVKRFSWSWVWLQMNTYVLMDKNFITDSAHIRNLVSKFPAMVRVQAASAFKRIDQPYDEFIKKGNKWDFYLQPLTTVHLHSANIGSQFLYTLGDIKNVYILSAVAFFMIILACVNFMNLSTAQAASRAKEVGIRKVLGSEKKQLIRQFLTEAMMYSVMSMIISLILVAIFLPLFNSVSGKTLAFNNLFQSGVWLFILLLTGITGLLAGSYPAFYLTSFNPVQVLKGGIFKKSLSNLIVRNGMVVFQFTVSIALIICTIILFQQLEYGLNKDLGLKKDNVIILPNLSKMETKTAETLRQQVSSIPGVLHAGIASGLPTMKSFGDTYIPEASGVQETLAKDIMINSFIVDEEFIPSLKIQLIAGRNFSKDFNDSTSVIINQTAAAQIGWKDPLGKTMTYPGNNYQRFKIIGIVKDFDVASIRNMMIPFALFHSSSKTYMMGVSYLFANVDAKNTKKILSEMEDKWKQVAPAVPFDYSFLDKNFEAMYTDDQRLGNVFGIFTVLSIFVGCLGLFGLSVYTAERRKKEIGVRKVLGASVGRLVNLLSREFVRLVLVAAIIAFPIAWWAMNKWLEDFVYKITIEWWVFALAAMLALLIAMLTIGFQALRAATANPVKSLRTE